MRNSCSTDNSSAPASSALGTGEVDPVFPNAHPYESDVPGKGRFLYRCFQPRDVASGRVRWPCAKMFLHNQLDCNTHAPPSARGGGLHPGAGPDIMLVRFGCGPPRSMALVILTVDPKRAAERDGVAAASEPGVGRPGEHGREVAGHCRRALRATSEGASRCGPRGNEGRRRDIGRATPHTGGPKRDRRPASAVRIRVRCV